MDIEMNMEPNEAWLDLNYAAKKRFDIYEEFIKTYKTPNVFRRDSDFENYNFLFGAKADTPRDFSIEYKGDDVFLSEIS